MFQSIEINGRLIDINSQNLLLEGWPKITLFLSFVLKSLHLPKVTVVYFCVLCPLICYLCYVLSLLSVIAALVYVGIVFGTRYNYT